MKRTNLIAAAAAVAVLTVLFLFVSEPSIDRVSADGGPHGGYRDVSGGLPDQCAACHRVHQGKSTGKLLKAESPYALCLTCHNGAGSRLDVLDGVKLGATMAPDAGVIAVATASDITVSVAPAADLAAGAGGKTDFTIGIRNRSAITETIGLVITVETNVDTTAITGDDANTFLEAVISTASVDVPAMVGSIPGIEYATLTTESEPGALEGDQTVTTVTATYSGGSAAISTQTRVSTLGLSALNGGGFRYISGTEVTSRHNADPADDSLFPWGFNANTGQNSNSLASPLQCTSCHNPHGTGNYRLLKESINGNDVVALAYFGGSFTKDEGAAGFEAGAPADKYTREYYGSAGTGGAPTTAGQGSLASLCGACHTAYPSDGASVGYTAGGTTHYRHKTEMAYTDWTNPETGGPASQNPELNPLTGFPALRLASNGSETDTIVTCLTCHRVHGSTSTMSGYALTQGLGGLGDNDLTPSQSATSTSTLLYTDNRGMCEACHQW